MKKILAYTLLFAVAGLFPLMGACYEQASTLNASEQEAAPAEPGQSAAQIPAVTQRFPQFENENVAVWKTVIVALKGGNLKILPEHGEPYVVTWETGKAYWLDADPPGQLHGDLNEGPDVIEVMVIEMRR